MQNELDMIQEQASTAPKTKNKKKHSKSKGSAVNGEQMVSVGKSDRNKQNTKKILLPTVDLQTTQKPVAPIANRKAAGANWEAVLKTNQKVVQKSNEQENVAVKSEIHSEVTLTKSARRRLKRRADEEKYVAIDCEMVGVGINGQDDMLARVSIVNKRGEVLLDKYVQPQEPVTDYRTSVSGIRPHDIINADEFNTVQDEVVQILQGKILVGHAIRNDLAVLHIKHSQKFMRDTSRYKPLCRLVANGRTPSLKRLSQAILGKEIQTGEHSSVEDARAAMSIYNLLAKDWEAYIKRHQKKD